MCHLFPIFAGTLVLAIGCQNATLAPLKPESALATNATLKQTALSAKLLHAEPDVSHRFPVLVRLTNESKSEVIVFRPLDGSDFGWHLPYYRFEVTRMNGEVLKPLGRCGVSGLWAETMWPASYAVRLAPGESYDVKLDPPQITEAGTYKVRFAYEYQVDNAAQEAFPTPKGAWVGIAEAPEIVVTF